MEWIKKNPILNPITNSYIILHKAYNIFSENEVFTVGRPNPSLSSKLVYSH